MHSQLALTEHASLNLAPLILLDTVERSCLDPNVDRGRLSSSNLISEASLGSPEHSQFSHHIVFTLSSLLRTLAALKPEVFCGRRCCEAGDKEAGEGEGGGGGEGASRGERSSSSSVIVTRSMFYKGQAIRDSQVRD